MPRSTASATKSKPKTKASADADEKPAKPASRRGTKSTEAAEPKSAAAPRRGRSAKSDGDAEAPGLARREPVQADAPRAEPSRSEAPVAIIEPRPVPSERADGGSEAHGSRNPNTPQGESSRAVQPGGGGRPLYQSHQQRQWNGGSGQQGQEQQRQPMPPWAQRSGPGQQQQRPNADRPSSNNPGSSSPRHGSHSHANNPSQTMNQSNPPGNSNGNNPSNSGSNAGAAVMNAPQNGPGNGGGNGGNGGNGGGGGYGYGGGNLSPSQKKRRRKKKKGGEGMGGGGYQGGGGHGHGGGGGGGGGGGSGGGGSGGGGQPKFNPRLGVMPNDEELEREARELTEKFSPKEYIEASRKAPNIADLQKTAIEELHKIAEAEGVADGHKYPRHELTFEILKRRAAAGGLMVASGTLDIMPDGGYGFLRSPLFSYLPAPDDVYVSAAQIRRMGLRKGMEVRGAVRAPKEGERFFALLRVDEVNGGDPTKLRTLPLFEDLTPLHPEQRYVLETSPDEIEMRIVDLVAPIGRGQRGLIVAPPRTGKTVLLQKMTRAIAKNYPDVKIIVLLIDERPEEVTDFRRNTHPSVEVIASTFDEDASRHVAVCEMVYEKSRRYVEFGMHVVILLDSITRLARAYNAGTSHSGKIMTGGIDSNALQRPKKFFGNARAIEGGGSLTILGTALVDTGSKADEVIFEEFKGTGNSELHLDRKLVDKRIWPAIDVSASGTRREELLLDPKELELTYRLRKVLADMNVVEALELMKSRLKKCKTNAEFLMSMQMGA
ncbi:MAG: transcription termination factor Rho [Phycisphaerales bacterium]